jgi:hypothetical protein
VHATPVAQDRNLIQGNPFRTVTSSKFIEGTEVEETAETKNVEIISKSSTKKSV